VLSLLVLLVAGACPLRRALLLAGPGPGPLRRRLPPTRATTSTGMSVRALGSVASTLALLLVVLVRAFVVNLPGMGTRLRRLSVGAAGRLTLPVAPVALPAGPAGLALLFLALVVLPLPGLARGLAGGVAALPVAAPGRPAASGLDPPARQAHRHPARRLQRGRRGQDPGAAKAHQPSPRRPRRRVHQRLGMLLPGLRLLALGLRALALLVGGVTALPVAALGRPEPPPGHQPAPPRRRRGCMVHRPRSFGCGAGRAAVRQDTQPPVPGLAIARSGPGVTVVVQANSHLHAGQFALHLSKPTFPRVGVFSTEQCSDMAQDLYVLHRQRKVLCSQLRQDAVFEVRRLSSFLSPRLH